MGKTDELWQRLLEQEKIRLSAIPLPELTALVNLSDTGAISGEGLTIRYCILLEKPDFRDDQVHSFILMAQRKIFSGLYRKYLAGFSVDSEGNIFSIADKTLYSHD